MTRPPIRLTLRRMIFVVALVAVCLALSRVSAPSDWVDVTVGPLPNDAEAFCLLTQDAQGVGKLPWYHSKVFPFTEDPFLSGQLAGGARDWDGDGFVTSSVQWRDARRYGILIHRRGGRWELRWLESDEINGPSVIRFLMGGGKAVIQISEESRVEVPPERFLRDLGLSLRPGQ